MTAEYKTPSDGQPTALTEKEIQKATKNVVEVVKSRGFGVICPIVVTGAMVAGHIGEMTDLWTPPGPV